MFQAPTIFYCFLDRVYPDLSIEHHEKMIDSFKYALEFASFYRDFSVRKRFLNLYTLNLLGNLTFLCNFLLVFKITDMSCGFNFFAVAMTHFKIEIFTCKYRISD